MMRILLLVMTALLTACGGGGGGGPAPVPPAAQPPGAQIEFLIQGTQLGTANERRTNIEVSPPADSGTCLVRIAGACAQPTEVAFSVNNNVIGVFDASGNISQQSTLSGSFVRPPQVQKAPPYVAVIYQDQYPGGVAMVKARVTATLPNGDLVRREGYVLTDFSRPFEAGFFGGSQSVQVGASITSFSPESVGGRLVGSTGSVVVVQATATGNTTNMQYVYAFAERPAGSTSTMQPDPASNTGHFTPDRPGDYVVSFTPTYRDGRTAYPVHERIAVSQASTSVGVFVDPAAQSDDRSLVLTFATTVTPEAARDATRFYIDAKRNGLQSNIVSVQGLLDGSSLGTITAPNVTRQQNCRGCQTFHYFAFDVPKSQLGATSHTFVATVTTNKGETYNVSLTFLGTGDAREQTTQTFAAN